MDAHHHGESPSIFGPTASDDLILAHSTLIFSIRYKITNFPIILKREIFRYNSIVKPILGNSSSEWVEFMMRREESFPILHRDKRRNKLERSIP